MESFSAEKMILFSKKRCLICWEGKDEYNLGELHNLQVFSVHYLCLLTGLNSYPSTYNEGLLGYLIDDIYRVYKTYLNKTCEYCKRSGASLECLSCKRKYHLPCGLKKGIRMQMKGTYPSYCKECACKVFPNYDNARKFNCAICFASPDKYDILYQPICCKPERMIHFDCLKLYALSAGYKMRCPLCMNTTKFRASVRKFGVYIPNSEAEWLVEKPVKFITYPLHCCANICVMNADSKMSSIVTPCIICDQKIAHVECTFSNIFLCVDCTTKLWPDTGVAYLESSETANLSKTFPWLFRLIETTKYGKSLQGVLNKILKLLGNQIKCHKSVDWHRALDVQTKVAIVSKIRECYKDLDCGTSTGEPVLKKVKR